jgi:hypothetical protein
MIALSKENIVVEAVSVVLLTVAVTSIAIEVINRNKPEKKTQKEKMTELGITIVVATGMYFLTKKILENK